MTSYTPAALQADYGARGGIRVARKPCETCKTDTLHIRNVCHECGSGGVTAADIPMPFGHELTRQQKAKLAFAERRRMGNLASRRARKGGL
jgi:hypothetical protein